MSKPTKKTTPRAAKTPLAASARELQAAADSLAEAASNIAFDRPSLTALADARKAVLGSVAKFEHEIDTYSEQDPRAASITALLPVAAASESVREWFPVDPEMTSVRGTILVPPVMTGSRDPEPPDDGFEKHDMLFALRRLLWRLGSDN